MAENSKIEWTDSTFNPWIGCTKVSPGCDNCYAAAQDKFRRWTPEGWGGPRKRTSPANWRRPLQWNGLTFVQCDACGRRGELVAAGNTGACPGCGTVDRYTVTRRRVFCASLADVFDNQVPIEWFVDFLDLCRLTPNLDKLVLTKRIGTVVTRLGEALHHLGQRRGCLVDPLFRYVSEWLRGTPPADVWLGATVVNQEEADRDIPKLLATPARVRFLSMEPLLGPVNLEELWGEQRVYRGDTVSGFLDWVPEIDQVIVGFESGPGARPGHPDWVRSLRDQCAAAGVPFLFKQWGEWAPQPELSKVLTTPRIRVLKNGGSAPWPPGFDPACGDYCMHRTGKKAAGRLLDGVEHNGFPEVRS